MKIYSMSLSWLLMMIYVIFGVYDNENFAEAVRSTTKCGSVFITVGSLSPGYIQMNWIKTCGAGDVRPFRINLYDRDIRRNKASAVQYVSLIAYENAEGFHETSIVFNKAAIPIEWGRNGRNNDDSYLSYPYWIVSTTNNDTIIDIQSLKAEMFWMYNNREFLRHLPIGSLLIPGTHNSGCYRGSGIYKNFIYTQDLTVWEQLVFGIRYLDLRIGYYSSDNNLRDSFLPINRYYINHDFMYTWELEIILSQIATFVKLAPWEVVVVDFHRFPHPSEWTETLHQNLIKLILHHLGTYALSKTYRTMSVKGPTMEEIWDSGKNVILVYGDSWYGGNDQELWPPISQVWANAIDVETLKSYLEERLNREGNDYIVFHASMAELTPRVIDVVLSKNNLRTLANYANPQVTKWVRDEWSDKLNIIATDYFLGNNVIQIAIDVNINK